MSDKLLVRGMSLQEIKATIAEVGTVVGLDRNNSDCLDYDYLETLAHEIDGLLNPERFWESPYADHDEEERVLESVAVAASRTHASVDEMLEFLDWAAQMNNNGKGFGLKKIKKLFRIGWGIWVNEV